MTRAELISTLADDQEMPRSRIDDILNALADLCADELKAERNFPFPGIGTLGRRREHNAPRFDLAPEMRAKIGVRQRIEGELCQTCHKKPRQPRKRQCSACRARDYRASKKRREILSLKSAI